MLDRIAKGLLLTEPERDHLHILAFANPAEPRYRHREAITPRLQHVLDAMPFSPAIIRTATWDVVAWNKAATVILTDYGKLPDGRRNILRMMFSDERVRAAQDDWRNVARYVVGAFRADAARAARAWKSPTWSSMSSPPAARSSRLCGTTTRSQASAMASSAFTILSWE